MFLCYAIKGNVMPLKHCFATKGIVFVCKVSDFRIKTLGYNLQKIANFLQNHLFLWISRMNLPKRDYRKAALGGAAQRNM